MTEFSKGEVAASVQDYCPRPLPISTLWLTNAVYCGWVLRRRTLAPRRGGSVERAISGKLDTMIFNKERGVQSVKSVYLLLPSSIMRLVPQSVSIGPEKMCQKTPGFKLHGNAMEDTGGRRATAMYAIKARGVKNVLDWKPRRQMPFTHLLRIWAMNGSVPKCLMFIPKRSGGVERDIDGGQTTRIFKAAEGVQSVRYREMLITED
jgi:hypothetical protein